MEIDEILRQLKRLDGPFPREAVAAAIAQREAITPHLLAALEDPQRVLDRLTGDDDYFLPIYAFFLLSQFRETRAYAPIVALFSLPGEELSDAVSDFVTEDLHRVLASVSGGDVEPIRSLVLNDEVGEYVQNAALRAHLTLMVEGVLSRQDIVDYLRHLFHGGLKPSDRFIWTGLVSVCLDIGASELRPEIRRAFREELIDEFFVDLSEAEKELAWGKKAAQRRLYESRRYHYIEDTIAELSPWACFRESRRSSNPAPSAVQVTLAPPPEKVGRNDPCPCGSGRKYKHCCGKPGR